MSNQKLLTYANNQIAKLKLGDSPSNCHGVIAYDDADGVRLTDGIGLDVICNKRAKIDSELSAMREWYDEICNERAKIDSEKSAMREWIDSELSAMRE